MGQRVGFGRVWPVWEAPATRAALPPLSGTDADAPIVHCSHPKISRLRRRARAIYNLETVRRYFRLIELYDVSKSNAAVVVIL